jgi:hypothetical protein
MAVVFEPKADLEITFGIHTVFEFENVQEFGHAGVAGFGANKHRLGW